MSKDQTYNSTYTQNTMINPNLHVELREGELWVNGVKADGLLVWLWDALKCSDDPSLFNCAGIYGQQRRLQELNRVRR